MSDTWTNRLSEYLDAELPANERAALEAHLPNCAECSATLAQLRRVVARAQGLDDRPPATDLWPAIDRKSTRLNSSHGYISYAVFCLKKKKTPTHHSSYVPPGHPSQHLIAVPTPAARALRPQPAPPAIPPPPRPRRAPHAPRALDPLR